MPDDNAATLAALAIVVVIAAMAIVPVHWLRLAVVSAGT